VASDDANETPLLIFRGTDPTNIHNLADDLHQHIGEMNCTRYARELEALVEESTLRYGRLHIMGHSYGGTIAQRLTAKFPHFIKRCTYHNAPACGHNVIQEYFRNIIQLPNNLPAPEVWSYRHAKDVASLLGGSPLPTDIGKNFTTGLVADTISSVDAHSFNSLSTGALLFPDMQAHPTVVEIAKQIEKMRKEASKVLPVYTRLRQIFSC
jgi:pimeloyl-ACP methyl ester carboxylesterase